MKPPAVTSEWKKLFPTDPDGFFVTGNLLLPFKLMSVAETLNSIVIQFPESTSASLTLVERVTSVGVLLTNKLKVIPLPPNFMVKPFFSSPCLRRVPNF